MTDNDSSTLTLSEIRSLAKMKEIREIWNRLAVRTPMATSFQTWEWNFGTAKFEGDRVSLRILVAKDRRGEVVGIAPFWIRWKALAGLNVLEFVGKGDYAELLFLEPYKHSFTQSVLEWVQGNDEWRILHLQNLRQESMGLLAQHSAFTILPCGVCPCVQLPKTLEEYEKKILQKRLGQKIRQKRKLLAREGRLAFSVSETPSQLMTDLAIFFDLHQQRQRAKGERGRFFKQSWRESFQEISLDLLEASLLRLGIVRIDGQPAASLYNVRFKGHECFYYGGMSPSLSEYSPGNLLHHWMIDRAITDGMRVYDFLKGDESYKSLWANERVDLFEVIGSRSKAEALLWQKARSLRNRIYRSRLIKQLYLSTIGRRRGHFPN